MNDEYQCRGHIQFLLGFAVWAKNILEFRFVEIIVSSRKCYAEPLPKFFFPEWNEL
jgi:hypothetical protein